MSQMPTAELIQMAQQRGMCTADVDRSQFSCALQDWAMSTTEEQIRLSPDSAEYV